MACDGEPWSGGGRESARAQLQGSSDTLAAGARNWGRAWRAFLRLRACVAGSVSATASSSRRAARELVVMDMRELVVDDRGRTCNVDRKLVSTFKQKSRQNAPIVKTLARMRPHDTW